jgi:type I restriction enzyme, S subunit
MKSGWQTVRLRDLSVEIIDGDRSSKYPKRSEFQSTGTPFLNSSIIVDNRLVFEEANFISDDKFSQITKGRVRSKDIVVTTRGNGVGKAAYFCDGFSEALVNAQMLILRADPKAIDPRFLFFQIISPYFQAKIRTHASGSAQPQIPIRDFRNLEVIVPPLAVQRRIAGILSNYDELLENSQRRVRILEAMARALYREWFVYFCFPGHEKLQRAASPVGDIPKGWRIGKFNDIVTYSRRGTKPGSQLDGRRYVPIGCLPSKSLALLEARPIEEAQSSLQLFESGDILFGAMRPYFHKVVIAPFAGVTRTTCFVLQPVQPEWHAFATMTAFEETTVAYANAHSQGATIPYAVWDGSLAEMPLALPPEAMLFRFEKVVAPIIARVSQSYFVLNNLRRTRDLLLPRLLSGQIDLEAA